MERAEADAVWTAGEAGVVEVDAVCIWTVGEAGVAEEEDVDDHIMNTMTMGLSTTHSEATIICHNITSINNIHKPTSNHTTTSFRLVNKCIHSNMVHL